MTKEESADRGKATFKYALFPIIFVACAVIIGLFVLLSLGIALKYGMTNGFLFFIFFVPISLIFASLMVLSYSNVVIDNERISRALWGVSWCGVSWNQVALIRANEVPVRGGQTRSIIVIVPKQSTPGRKLRNMGFYRDVDAVGSLIAALNTRIARYSISVERNTPSTSVRTDCL